MTVPGNDRPDCTCAHALECNHGCHGRHCDPTEHVCSLEFLPDDGGLTPWGCAECTPGERSPHLDGCPSVTLVASAPSSVSAASAAAAAASSVGSRPIVYI